MVVGGGGSWTGMDFTRNGVFLRYTNFEMERFPHRSGNVTKRSRFEGPPFHHARCLNASWRSYDALGAVLEADWQLRTPGVNREWLLDGKEPFPAGFTFSDTWLKEVFQNEEKEAAQRPLFSLEKRVGLTFPFNS
jgi:hypothetical protein